MNRRDVLFAMGGSCTALAGCGGGGGSSPTQAPEPPPPVDPGDPRAAWAATAQSLIPTLIETEQRPIDIVRAVADPSLPLRFRMEREATADLLNTYTFGKGESFILDFGGHRAGFLSFELQTVGRAPDAPARLRLTFGEVPTDVAEPLYPYNGRLSQGWLPDEVINVDDLPQAVRLPRRYAFRYVKVEVIDTSGEFRLRFENVKAHAITSAATAVAPLVADAEMLRRIDEVAVATLRDCMQTTFEDGPRRDRRLWLGDLRLQGLANYATFRQNDLVKRCLYLFASLSREDGFVAACVYEKPVPRYGEAHIIDYAALFNVTLLDYLVATGDTATARDLWPVAKRQLEIIAQGIDANGLYRDPGNVWIFIDWSDPLDRNAAIQGLLIYAYRQTLDLARRIGTEGEVSGYQARIDVMTAAARQTYWDDAQGVAVSGASRQVSWASQVWLTLGGVLSPTESERALTTALDSPTAVRPTTPYLYHYVIEALLAAGLNARARQLLESYWGGMVAAGADTFWELYDPAQPLSANYGDIHATSYCHAWSCTPSYFLRRGLLQG
ncbi:alpha-L-rhamnosidase-related protein [Peristeroidobacter agariperforans]|uniref:alpha-L-rhamnosidase-related protein n=1 Tax=Peristeroidobacter agariperforans TaxID=268404 RepID=UPI00101C6F8B|nr:family 78 glycoside hydrolase catalytic domain [Peristeroidobacter agariperforans]